MSRYVLDSFAVISLRQREAAGMRVRQLMRGAENRFWMSVINAGEVFYRMAREHGFDVAEDVWPWFARQPIGLVDANRQLTVQAARLKARYPISYADSFAAALAIRLNAQVVTGDPEFLPLEADGIVRLAWLQARRR